MITLRRLNYSNAANHVALTNTPSFLVRKLIDEPVVKETERRPWSEIAKRLKESNKRRRQKLFFQVFSVCRVGSTGKPPGNVKNPPIVQIELPETSVVQTVVRIAIESLFVGFAN